MNRKAYELGRTIFLCLIAVYTAVREVPALNFLISSTVVSAGVLALGFLVFLWGMLLDGRPLKDRKTDLLVAFLAITAVSCLLNRKYGFGDNLKAMGAMFLFFFVFFPSGVGDTKETRRREIRAVSAALSAVWNALSAVSVGMYLFSVEFGIRKTFGLGAEAAQTGNELYLSTSTQGYSAEFSRLWGLFQDPNYASFVSVAVMLGAVYFLLTSKKVWIRVLNVLSLLIQFSYLVLGGSRSGLIVLLLSFALAAAYYVMSRMKTKKSAAAKSILAGVLAAVLAAGLLFGLRTVSLRAFPYVKAAVQSASSESMTAGVQNAYASLYKLGRVTIVSGSGAIDPDAPVDEPTTEPTTDETATGDTDPETSTAHTDVPTPIQRTDTNKDDISNGRFMRWKQALSIFKTAPVFGTSPRNIFDYAREHNPDTVMAKFKIYSHNGYIDVLTCTGVVGAAVLFVFLALAAFVVLRRFLKFEGDPEFMLSGAAFFAFAVSAVFVSDLFFMISIGGFLFWTMMGHAVHAEGEPVKPGFGHKLSSLVLKPLWKKNAAKKAVPENKETAE